MFAANSLFGQLSICPSLFRRQPVQLRVLGRNAAVGMQFMDAQIAAVGQAKGFRRQRNFTLFEQAKIMQIAIAKRGAHDFLVAQIDRHLGFLRVAPFLAAVVLALFFFGRSMGCSVTSTMITSKTVSLGCKDFLPGRRNWPESSSAFSTFAMVRQTVASLTP